MSQITRSASLRPENKQFAYGPFTELNSQKELGLFLSDTWRVRQNLTLNQGVRWELDFAPRNTNGIYTTSGYDTVFGPSGEGNLFKPGTYTNRQLPQFELTDIGRKPYRTNFTNVAPSLGLAWTPNAGNHPWLKRLLGEGGKTVLRGGYSIAYIREGFNTFHSMWGLNQGPTVTLSVNPNTLNTAAFVGPNGLSGPGSVLFRDATLPAAALPQARFPLASPYGTSYNEWDPNLRMGYTQSWTFGWQRELTKDTALEVRYVGNHGTKLWRQLNLNETNIFENGFLNEFKIAQENLRLARVANPASNNFGLQAAVAGTRTVPVIAAGLNTTNDATFAATIQRGLAGSLASTIATNNASLTRLMNAGLISSTTMSDGTRVSNHFLLNPVAGAGGSFLVTNGGHTTYNALQVEVRRRMAKGLLMEGSYTFAKSITNMFASSSSVLSQPRSLRFPEYDKGLSPWDLRHAFKINSIYELPVGKGRRYLAGAPGLNKVLEGWQISGVARIQSGTSNLITSGRPTLNTQDSGFLLKNITRRELQKLVDIRKEPNRVIYWLPQALIDNTLAAFETGGKTLADLKPNEPHLAPAATPGEFGERLFLNGPWQQRIDLNILKRTKIGEKFKVDFRVQFLNAFNITDFFISGLADASSQGIANTFGQTRTAFRDITVSGTNDPGGRLIEFQLRLNF